MPNSQQHRRLSSVRACMLLILVYLGVCAVLFGDETRPGLSGLSDSLSPVPTTAEHG